ncbi:MAG: plsC [Ramlibacter sp.]|nr:plsC [Ramlibacter sp.]
MNVLRGCWRLVRALGVVLAGWSVIVFLFPRMSAAAQQERVQAWARQMLRVLGVTLEVRGNPLAQGPLLLVANHISWLDILVMHAARHCRFVSKSDVKRWPLIGTLATGGGTLYIERESRRDAMRVVHRMADSLRSGEILAAFPEGTTTDGLSLLPFHGNLIQAAISADARAQPVALRYLDAASGGTSLTPSYIGDDSLVGSLWRTVSGPPVAALVRFGEPQHAQGRDRRRWAQDLRTAVEMLRRD